MNRCNYFLSAPSPAINRNEFRAVLSSGCTFSRIFNRYRARSFGPRRLLQPTNVHPCLQCRLPAQRSLVFVSQDQRPHPTGKQTTASRCTSAGLSRPSICLVLLIPWRGEIQCTHSTMTVGQTLHFRLRWLMHEEHWRLSLPPPA